MSELLEHEMGLDHPGQVHFPAQERDHSQG